MHNPIKRLQHGVEPGAAEHVTGLKSDARCAGFAPDKSKNSVSPRFPKPNDIKWYLLSDPAVRKELRGLYDAAPGKAAYEQRDCRYRVHARRGDHGVATSSGVVANSSYVCLVESILRRDASAKVCVFSEGEPAHFGPLDGMDRVELVLNGDPLETFHNFVTAPVLFLSHSFLSGAASVLATQAKIYLVPFEVQQSRAVADCFNEDAPSRIEGDRLCNCGGFAHQRAIARGRAGNNAFAAWRLCSMHNRSHTARAALLVAIATPYAVEILAGS